MSEKPPIGKSLIYTIVKHITEVESNKRLDHAGVD